MPSSSRIHAALTASSMTPRTAQNYLAYLSTLTHAPSSEEILYTEAKLALGEGDTDMARTLFDQCPTEYKRVRRYVKQLDTYDTLCTQGVIDRRNTLDVRVFLANLLDEEIDCPSVVRYADALCRHGYNRRSLETLTMSTMDRCMEHANMNDGHRCLFTDAICKRTPCHEFVFMTIVRLVERFGHVAVRAKQTLPLESVKKATKEVLARCDEDEEDEEDECDTGGVDEDDETAGDDD